MAYPVIPAAPVIAAAPIDGQKATYSASIVGLVPAATATDVFTLTGSATKTIRVTRIEVSGLATTAGTVDAVLVTRSTADTGGTSAAVAAVPHDSASAAASGTALSYTANPTQGTAVGKLRAQRVYLNVAATGSSDKMIEAFGDRPSQDIVLRGASQVLAINLNGGTIPTGAALDIAIEWTEE